MSNKNNTEYFSGLNYSLANEDTFIEYQLMNNKTNHVLSVAGSGARVLPLLAKNPKKITVIDVSQEQLFLTELRYQAAKHLTYEEFLFFFGYRGSIFDGLKIQANNRKELLNQLPLTTAAKSFFKSIESLWDQKGFLLLGKWEQHFIKLHKIFRTITNRSIEKIFDSNNLDEQIENYHKYFPHKRFKLFCQLAAHPYVFNRLYKGNFSGNRSNFNVSTYIWNRFDSTFRTQLVRKNFFLQFLFLGKIYYEEGLPWEVNPTIFSAIKSSQTELEFKKEDLLSSVCSQKFDFYSLSDVISYLPTEQTSIILQKIAELSPPPHSRVVLRSFLYAPPLGNTNLWIKNEQAEQWALSIEAVPVYQFHIYDFRGQS
ncbi:MAG: DUF3419 family protein [Pseudobdellovibrionaceae bacterium]|nr:DUF3419 family protein [Pseudobdellovibrionaceae bacterium]